MAHLGDIKISADYEVLKQGPLDVRSKKNTKYDLINPEMWASDGDTIYVYPSMLVGIEDTGNIYVLKDRSKMFEPDFSGWQLLGGEGGTSADFTELEVLIKNIQGNDTGYTDDNGYFVVPTIREIAEDEANAVAANISTNVQNNANSITSLSAATQTIADELSDITSAVEEITNITVNGKNIVDNPVLDSDDIKLSNAYSVLNTEVSNITPGDVITQALSKMEVMLANTTLSITAALNDLDYRIGRPSEVNENGEVTQEATGIHKLIEEITQRISELE